MTVGFCRTGRRTREGACDGLLSKSLVLMAAGLRMRGGRGREDCIDGDG